VFTQRAALESVTRLVPLEPGERLEPAHIPGYWRWVVARIDP